MAYQAIETRYFGPGNVRGARVKAYAAAGSLTLSWDHALNAEDNHRVAAAALCSKYGWHTHQFGRLHMGVLPGNRGYVFVFGDDD